jgi:hypothetical protein
VRHSIEWEVTGAQKLDAELRNLFNRLDAETELANGYRVYRASLKQLRAQYKVGTLFLSFKLFVVFFFPTCMYILRVSASTAC